MRRGSVEIKGVPARRRAGGLLCRGTERLSLIQGNVALDCANLHIRGHRGIFPKSYAKDLRPTQTPKTVEF